jgi:hypothetical protein
MERENTPRSVGVGLAAPLYFLAIDYKLLARNLLWAFLILQQAEVFRRVDCYPEHVASFFFFFLAARSKYVTKTSSHILSPSQWTI